MQQNFQPLNHQNKGSFISRKAKILASPDSYYIKWN